jgi:hypothetical protein
MITKRDAELVEKIVRSLGEDRYWRLVKWLTHGCDGPLWDHMQPRRRRRLEDKEQLTALSPRISR